MSSESYAGITVPEGEPDGLRSAGGRFNGLAESLDAVCSELTGLPTAMTSWQGPASVLYADSCMTQAGGARHAVGALHEAAHAARAFARDLEDAQREAREAIRDAKDAQDRIDAANKAIDAAQADQAAASVRADQASHVLAVSSAAGAPSPAAQADLDAAATAGQEAAGREAAARRDLERAQDDLERAKRRGERAEEHARDAASAAAAAFAPAGGFPGGVPVGAPAAGAGGGGFPGTWWNGRNDGAQWFNEDDFLKTLWPFHPGNDDFERGKWFGDTGAGFATSLLESASFAAAGAARTYATTPWLRTSVTRATYLTTINGRPAAWGSFTRITQTLEPPPPGIVRESTLAASRMSKLGWAARGGGVALAGVSGFVDQWHEDSGRTDLTTTDRVGRSAGVGTYMMGAAATGAVIGSVIPVGGTITGAVVGAGVGLAIGAAANAWEPGKEWAANAGQTVANGVVDGYNGVKDGIAEGVSNLADDATETVNRVRDLVPDVDMPDLNPF
jgi:hypothetical protein